MAAQHSRHSRATLVDYISHAAKRAGRFLTPGAYSRRELTKGSRLKRAIWIVAAVACAWIALNFVPGCSDLWTDSATRAAYDLEEAASATQRSSAQTYTLVHRPKASPEGCSHDYSFQLSQSALLMWCKSAEGTSNVASHATTYHLRYVDVPEQINLEKRAGEPVTIELQKTSGKPKVLRAY